jgi:4-amino-4-deoxy-L-arabinose transferase-like glycosyltransferase
MIPVLLSALTAVAVWRLGLRTIGRWGAATAAAIIWTFPSHLVWRSVHFHIFYASEMLLAALALLLVVRIRDSASRRDVALLGLVVGVGLWQSFQLATIFPAAIAWLLVRRREVRRDRQPRCHAGLDHRQELRCGEHRLRGIRPGGIPVGGRRPVHDLLPSRLYFDR